jgi:hypothetical protein
MKMTHYPNKYKMHSDYMLESPYWCYDVYKAEVVCLICVNLLQIVMQP